MTFKNYREKRLQSITDQGLYLNTDSKRWEDMQTQVRLKYNNVKKEYGASVTMISILKRKDTHLKYEKQPRVNIPKPPV